MRILILANNDIGLYKFRKDLIKELLTNNEVYISLPYGELVNPLVEAGCRFIETEFNRRSTNPIGDLFLYAKYKKIIKSIKPELIITYTIKPNIYGGYASHRSGIDYAVNITGLGTAFERQGVLSIIVQFLYKAALKDAKVVFFENSANRDFFVSKKIINNNQTCLLDGAGVDTDYYSYEEYPDNSVCRFLFVGRVMKEKGIDELLTAIKRLISEGTSCFLDIVGPFEDDYKDKLETCENEGWAKYYGYQEDVRPYIKNSDCFVLPSYHEGMANTNLECASSGRPVITSNIPGCKEAVIENKTGLLCEAKNADSLYSALKKFLNLNKEEKKKMGIEGRRHMIEVFDKRKVVAKTIKALFQ